MVWPLLTLLVAALLAVPLVRLLPRAGSPLLALAMAGVCAGFARHLPWAAGAEWVVAYPWIESLGVQLAFRLDGLALLFALLITGIGALVVLYAGGYLAGDPRLGRLQAYLLLFAAAMLGLVLSDDLVTLFVFWELTSFASFLLIGFDHEKVTGRKAALQALVITGAGGLAMLAGFILLAAAGQRAGVAAEDAWRISALVAVDVRADAAYLPALLLILAGALTKSAQVPAHFWLPGAMAAPTPVSAYLHSATMVKAGVFLLARLQPALGATTEWHVLVTLAGALTMLAGAVLSALQFDLKRILAYTTLSVLGTLTMLLGLGTEMAIKAAVVYLVAHALYKACLFLVAGNVDHAAGTRDVVLLSGLGRVMPFTAAAGIVAALSQAGAPPLFGFFGKELIYQAKLDLGTVGVVLMLLAVVANVFLVAMSLVVAVWPFFHRRRPTPHEPHEAAPAMLAGPLLLAAASLAVGISDLFSGLLGEAAASAIAGRPVAMKLKLWHGLNPESLIVLAASGLTVAVGFGLFLRMRENLAHGVALARRLRAFTGDELFDRGLGGLYAAAERLTSGLDSGRLIRHLRVLAIALLAGAGHLLVRAAAGRVHTWRDLHVDELLLGAVILTGAVLATVLRGRLAAVAALGVVGFSLALLFANFSAPDLAVTQIVVEALAVIIFVFVFSRLPRAAPPQRGAGRALNLGLALAVGAVMAAAVLAVAPPQGPSPLAKYFREEALPAGRGRNVVNVILVDFRGLDTLGETTVVASAAVGVYALLRGRRRLDVEQG